MAADDPMLTANKALITKIAYQNHLIYKAFMQPMLRYLLAICGIIL
jgi:hypothetical protein